MGALNLCAVLLGLGGVTIVPSFVTKDIRWGLVGFLCLLLVLVVWAAYRLICQIEPRLSLDPRVEQFSALSPISEAYIVVNNTGVARVRNATGTIRGVWQRQDGQIYPMKGVENQLIYLRWRGLAANERRNDIDSKAILEVMKIDRREGVDMPYLCAINSSTGPSLGGVNWELNSKFDWEIEIEVVGDNAPRQIERFRLTRVGFEAIHQ